jgi:amidase
MLLTEIHYESLHKICGRIKSGELTATQVTESMLDRIGSLDKELRSYVKVLADSALATASRLDEDRKAGHPLGALHGVPIAVKDLFYTAGVATASGTKVMEHFIPQEDATVVSRLKDAGAVLIGKTQLTEGAFGVHHPDIDPPRNPWNPEHWPGVSSSGSAVAVAAGLAFAALGSDTGGSIRFPCASCGLVGIKPTYGRVSRYGAFPLAETLDHVGPIARSVADAARVLQVLAGQDPKDSSTLPAPVPNYSASLTEEVADLTIGVDWTYISQGVSEEVTATLSDALEIFVERGAKTVEVTMPASHVPLVRDWSITCGVECARAHGEYYPAKKELYGPVLANLIEIGLNASREDYAALQVTRAEFTTALDELLAAVDVLIMPCMPTLPPTVSEMRDISSQDESRADFLTFTSPFNYSGHPSITLPAGLSDAGLPKSFQLIACKLGEPILIRAGSAYESVLNFIEHPVP